MKAKVTKPFPGCRDGSPRVEQFAKGDVIEGDLARVAVEQKWATEVKAKPDTAAAEKEAAEKEAAEKAAAGA